MKYLLYLCRRIYDVSESAEFSGLIHGLRLA